MLEASGGGILDVFDDVPGTYARLLTLTPAMPAADLFALAGLDYAALADSSAGLAGLARIDALRAFLPGSVVNGLQGAATTLGRCIENDSLTDADVERIGRALRNMAEELVDDRSVWEAIGIPLVIAGSCIVFIAIVVTVVVIVVLKKKKLIGNDITTVRAALV